MTQITTIFRTTFFRMVATLALPLVILPLVISPAAAQQSKLQSPIPSTSASVGHVFTEAKDEHTVGDALAPHTLIVYASVVCGHCGTWFSQDYPVLKKRLIDTGKLRLVFREFPTQPADVALAGFQIANCAADEDYFDALLYQFQNQTETFNRLRIGEGRARFLELAKVAGLENEDEMLSCLEKAEGKKRIETAMARAKAGGVDAVPSLILDGALMPGLNGAKEVLEALGEPTNK